MFCSYSLSCDVEYNEETDVLSCIFLHKAAVD